MPSGLILDELDLNLSSASLLVRLWFLLVVIVIGTAVDCVAVVDKRVIGDTWMTGMSVLRVGRVSCHVHSLALAHINVEPKKPGISSQKSKKVYCRLVISYCQVLQRAIKKYQGTYCRQYFRGGFRSKRERAGCGVNLLRAALNKLRNQRYKYLARL
jgi:hypothetical protein